MCWTSGFQIHLGLFHNLCLEVLQQPGQWRWDWTTEVGSIDNHPVDGTHVSLDACYKSGLCPWSGRPNGCGKL